MTDDDFHALMMEWGARRSGYTDSRLGFGRSVYDRMMSGLRGTTCSKCIGRGVVHGLLADGTAPVNVSCPICKGNGKIKVATRGKINPAMIPSTAPGAPYVEEPQIFSLIDKAMQRLTIKQRIVLVTRYVDYPRRGDSDRRWQNVNAWFAKIGARPIGKQYLVQELLPDAKRALQAEVDNSRV